VPTPRWYEGGVTSIRHSKALRCVHNEGTHAVTMKSVGVREFRANASTYLSGTEPIAVNRHGKVIGFYIPLERNDDEVERAVALLPETLEKVIGPRGGARRRRR